MKSNSNKSSFELETLEQRVLLSADGFAVMHSAPSETDSSPSDVIIAESASLHDAGLEDVEYGAANSLFESCGEADLLADTALVSDPVAVASVEEHEDPEAAIESADEAPGRLESGVQPEADAPIFSDADANSITDELTATLNASNPPPADVDAEKAANSPENQDMQDGSGANGGVVSVSGDLHLEETAPVEAENGVIVGEGETLSGSGAIEGDVLVEGVVSPGNSPGIQTISGNQTYAFSSTLEIELGGLIIILNSSACGEGIDDDAACRD